MRKFLSVLALPLMIAAPVSGEAAILGPDAAVCANGQGPALLVRVSGFKNRAGTVRARTFAGASRGSWFDKKAALKRTAVAVPDSGLVDICMPVSRPGPYVVDIRHDINGNGDTDRADGAGASGNPETSLFDFLLGKKPPAAKVVVNAGPGVTMVSITLKYLQGGSFKPVQVSRR